MTYDGNSSEEIEKLYEQAAKICLDSGAVDVFISDTDERQESIWSARGAFLEAQLVKWTSVMLSCRGTKLRSSSGLPKGLR